MVQVSLMAAVVVVLANTPLGMIQLPVIKATTVHIPVILGALLLGPAAGAILGGTFGLCSVISNTLTPHPAFLCIFSFSKQHSHWKLESPLDLCGLPCTDGCCRRMAMDASAKMQIQPLDCPPYHRVYKLYGQHLSCNGQHLFSVGP